MQFLVRVIPRKKGRISRNVVAASTGAASFNRAPLHRRGRPSRGGDRSYARPVDPTVSTIAVTFSWTRSALIPALGE